MTTEADLERMALAAAAVSEGIHDGTPSPHDAERVRRARYVYGRARRLTVRPEAEHDAGLLAVLALGAIRDLGHPNLYCDCRARLEPERPEVRPETGDRYICPVCGATYTWSGRR